MKLDPSISAVVTGLSSGGHAGSIPQRLTETASRRLSSCPPPSSVEVSFKGIFIAIFVKPMVLRSHRRFDRC